MFLWITYVRRAFAEFNTPRRIYDAIYYAIEDGGLKIDFNNMEIIPKTTKVKKKVNNQEIVEDIIYYSRNIKSNNFINVDILPVQFI